MNLERFEVLLCLATEAGVSAPVRAVTLPPPEEPAGLAEETRELSRKRYGRDPADMEADVGRRRAARKPPEARRKPRTGGVEWE
jgi:hypothetical protein